MALSERLVDHGPLREMRQSESAGRVLLVTDDAWYGRKVTAALGRDGLGVDAVATGRDGLHWLQQGASDIVLLDSALPDCAASDLRARMLSLATIPVVLFGAGDDQQDVVFALEHGAADYVTRPDRLQEVVSRVRAILRRTRSQPRGGRAAERQGPVRARQRVDHRSRG